MSVAPGESLPKLCGSWSDLKAAYRLLSSDAADPHAIQAGHRAGTLAACAEHPVVLCVQDTTELDLTSKAAMKGRGKLGGGSTQGLLQHTALAVVPAEDHQPLDGATGRLLGVLHQQWATRTQAPDDQTLRQLQARRTDADVWQETAEAVAELGATPARLIHVGDRHSDVFRFFDRCRSLNHSFVVRVRYDRALVDDDPRSPRTPPAQAMGRLFETLDAQPEADSRTLTVHEQRTAKGQTRCAAREATLTIRMAAVTVRPPANDPRTAKVAPVQAHAVLVRESAEESEESEGSGGGDSGGGGSGGLQWMLLTSETIATVEDAWRIVRYYRHRWLIEEWHRVLKEGCRVEAAQFDDAMDVQRLAAIKGIIAVRLLQLRDLAEAASDDPRSAAQLQRTVPRLWIQLVATLAHTSAADLTPKQFFLTIARRGGYLARKRDPRPGWKVLWRGWHDIHLMVQGAELLREKCG